MSDRSPFVTAFVYCPDCLKAARKVFADGGLVTFDQAAGPEGLMGWFGGMLRTLSPGDEEVRALDIDARLETVVCHPFRWVLASETDISSASGIHDISGPRRS